MGEFNGAMQFKDLFSLGVDLLLQFAGSRELQLQLFPQVEELIFNNGENVGRCH